MRTVERIRRLCPIKRHCHYLFITAMVGILILASLKNTPRLGGLTSYDKFNHLAAFFVLCLVFEVSFPVLRSMRKILVLIGFAITIECVQYLIPWRSSELLDIFAGTLGIAVFYTSCLTIDLIQDNCLRGKDDSN